jgi:putative endonuclease
MRPHQLGQEGERFAVEFLRQQGYSIIKANYRTKVGEIDLIARDGETIAFIEVKTRKEDGWDAFEAVHPAKQRKMFRVAEQYLVEAFGKVEVKARFDVLAVFHAADGSFKAELLRDAFMK